MQLLFASLHTIVLSTSVECTIGGKILLDKSATLFYSINYIKLGVDSIVHFQMLKVKIDEQKYFDRSSKKVCTKT